MLIVLANTLLIQLSIDWIGPHMGSIIIHKFQVIIIQIYYINITVNN